MHDWQSLSNEDTVSSWWYGVWSTPRTCFHFHFSQRWQGAKPIIPETIFIGFVPARFSHSGFILNFTLRTWASVHFRIQCCTIDELFGTGLYSTFHSYILGIPMITSKRTLYYLGLIWFCMHGIQFPTDLTMDHFLSSVCVCVWLGGFAFGIVLCKAWMVKCRVKNAK